MGVHLLDPRKVAQVLSVPWQFVEIPDDKGSIFSWYLFKFGSAGRNGLLLFHDREPNTVTLSFVPVEEEHECNPFVSFNSLTRVAYNDEENALILESHTLSHFTVLRVEATGNVRLVTDKDAMIYEGSQWDEEYRAITQKHERRLQELRTMPYQDYLLTPEWQERRNFQLARSGYRCQVCNTADEQLNVHHRTYERRGNEAPSDLITLCRGCHDLFHNAGKLPKEDSEGRTTPRKSTQTVDDIRAILKQFSRERDTGCL